MASRRSFPVKRLSVHLYLINLENFVFDKNGNSLEKLTNIIYRKEIKSLKMSYPFDFIAAESLMVHFPQKPTLEQ